MVKINLLPSELKTKRSIQEKQARFLAVAGLIVLLQVAVFAFVFIQNMGRLNRLEAIEAEKAAVEAEIAQFSVYSQLQSDVNNKVSLLKKAMGMPLPWLEILENLGNAIPSNVWLTDFVLVQPGGTEAGEMTIRGLTYDHPSTARWTEALRDVDNVSDVRVMFSAEENVQNVTLVRFELRAKLLPVSEYEPLAGRGE